MGREASYYDPDKLAESFLTQYYVFAPGEGCGREAREKADWKIRWWRGGFYDWHKGRYRPADEAEMSVLVTGFLQELNKLTYMPPDPPIKITQSLVRNVLLNVSGVEGVYLSDWRELNSWTDVDMAGGEKAGMITISFLNGLAMFGQHGEEPAFVEHTPKYFTLARLPYEYQQDADCPKWKAFLNDVMEGDSESIELLQQWAGYLLTSSAGPAATSALKYQKFMLIAGEGGNGKTVFATILEKTVGEENVSHIPLSSFGDRFALHATLGKMLNSTSESSHGINEACETMLKSYTSGDRMTFERKFREPISCHPTAKVMISTNQLPSFTDKSNGIWRRMLFVPFDKTIPIDRQNPELVDELAKELPGIFNWAYEGLRKLTGAGPASPDSGLPRGEAEGQTSRGGRFIEPKRCKEAIGEYRRDTNPARVFLEENYIEGFDFEGVPCGEVYQSYVAWCAQNGYHPLNANNFGKEVKRAFTGVAKEQRRQNGRRVWVYQGLVVKEDSEVATGILVVSVTDGTKGL